MHLLWTQTRNSFNEWTRALQQAIPEERPQVAMLVRSEQNLFVATMLLCLTK